MSKKVPFPEYDPTRDLSLAPDHRRKRGMGASPLLESEIKRAQEKARSAAEAARLLGVSYNTYRKYAKMYGILEDLKNPNGIGIVKGGVYKGKSASLDDILNGNRPNYPLIKLQERLIKSGYMEEKCSNCGFDERRITDYRVPITLDFLDGNRKNHRFENIRFLCYNCKFLLVGNIVGRHKDYTEEDLKRVDLSGDGGIDEIDKNVEI